MKALVLDFDGVISDSAPESFLERFHQRFYEERRRLRRADIDSWLALMGPYPPFVDLLRRRSNDVVLPLATAKDAASVSLLLRAYGVADLFPTY